MSKEICNFCQLGSRRNPCIVPEAEPTSYASEVLSPHECRHFTCGEGLNQAREKLATADEREKVEVTMIDGEICEGFPFGSTDKPYSTTGRIVRDDGVIITHSEVDDVNYISPQRVPERR